MLIQLYPGTDLFAGFWRRFYWHNSWDHFDFSHSCLYLLTSSFKQSKSILSMQSWNDSSVDQFDIYSIHALVFCTGCLMTKLHLIRHRISYDVKYIFVTKHTLQMQVNWYRDYVSIIDRRFRDRMVKWVWLDPYAVLI